MKLSFVVPCYNEEGNVKLFYDDVVNSFKKTKYDIEIIFINDGSKDNTINELKKIVKSKDFNIKIINFSRNFGKEAGIYAGLQNSTGDYAVLIDADMQQPPSLVFDMLKIIEQNDDVDIVVYYQEKRNESKILSFFKSNFYKTINKLTGLPFVNGASDFRLLKRNVVDTILKFTEHERFSKGIFAWIGFNTYYIPYVPRVRATGNTSWSFTKLFKYAINGILSFVEKPFKWITNLGIICILISLITFLLTVTHVCLIEYIVSLVVFMFGLNFVILGYMGEFINRNYNESRNRPMYIVKEVISNEKNNEHL